MLQLILNLDNKELEDNLKDFAKKHKKALEHITDSASYIHNLRRQSKS